MTLCCVMLPWRHVGVTTLRKVDFPLQVWEVETGRQMYHIFEAHGPNVEVVSAAVDDVGMRMITGAYDGQCHVFRQIEPDRLTVLFFVCHVLSIRGIRILRDEHPGYS